MPSNPSEWIRRTRVNVKVGLSPAERNRKATALGAVLQQQMQLLQQGGNNIIVNLNGIHRAMLDWSKSVDLDNPEKYWIDPESQGSQEASQAQSQAAQAKEQQQLLAFTAEATANDNNSQRDFQIDQQKILFSYFDAILKAETEDAKIIGDTVKQAQQAANQSSNGSAGNGEDLGSSEG